MKKWNAKSVQYNKTLFFMSEIFLNAIKWCNHIKGKEKNGIGKGCPFYYF